MTRIYNLTKLKPQRIQPEETTKDEEFGKYPTHTTPEKHHPEKKTQQKLEAQQQNRQG